MTTMMRPIETMQDINDILGHVAELLNQLDRDNPKRKFNEAAGLTAEELKEELITVFEFFEVDYPYQY